MTPPSGRRTVWERETLGPWLARHPERQTKFTSRYDGELELKTVYSAEDRRDAPIDDSLPGEYPFTRGAYPNMHRGRLWTMRTLTGFGTARETNTRLRMMLDQGLSGLNIPFDMPTNLGYDSDHSFSEGAVGATGVHVDTIEDMRTLFEGIQLDEVSTSFVINATSPVILAMYEVVAEEQGVDRSRLRGTLQNDTFTQFNTCHFIRFPLDASLRFTTDVMEYCIRHLPGFYPISLKESDVREAGCNASQGLAFVIADGLAHLDSCLARGLTVDEVAPKLSFLFATYMEFFEEIAKLRAARRMWARLMRERYHASEPESWRMKFYVQAIGSTYTREQPYNNMVRGTLEALSAVLGGCQALHISCFDEVHQLPSEFGHLQSLRTQQVLALESGVASVADPLGGSYYVESLTDEIEHKALAELEKVEEMGGLARASEEGYFMQLANAGADRLYGGIESGDIPLVGSNCFQSDEEVHVPKTGIDPAGARDQVERLNAIRRTRDNDRVQVCLRDVADAVVAGTNVMEPIKEVVRAQASVGEICDVLEQHVGKFRDPAIVASV